QPPPRVRVLLIQIVIEFQPAEIGVHHVYKVISQRSIRSWPARSWSLIDDLWRRFAIGTLSLGLSTPIAAEQPESSINPFETALQTSPTDLLFPFSVRAENSGITGPIIPDPRRIQPNRPTVERPLQRDIEQHLQRDSGRTVWEWQHLTGDWSGLRPALGERGFNLESSLTVDVSRNFRGGLNSSRTIARQLFDVNATVFTEPLGGWEGGTFFVDYQYQSGPFGGILTGDFQGFANNGTDGISQIAQLWFEQLFLDETWRVRLGKVDANSQFAFVEHGGEFLNSSMGFSPTIFVFPSYPDPASSVTVFWTPTDEFYAGAGIFDGDANRGVRTGLHGPLRLVTASTSVFVVGESGLRWGTEPTELQGRLGLGFWHHTGVFDRFDGAHQAGTSGFYGIFDQQLVWEIPEDPEDNQGLAMFLQIGTADKSVSDVDLHLGAGLVWHGLIPMRDFDGLGLGFSYVRFSSEPGTNFSTNGELATELFYKMQWVPWCYTTFDLQHIHDSGGDASLSDALVGTIRAGFLF
ncbi:MAG: carbohydrate porin, partial [Planctomycetota bacterium]|nr:carbohydrate porin [Planctomycetota bacterium]